MSAAGTKLSAVTESRVPETHRFAGIVTSAELREAGLSPGQVRTLVRRRVLAPLALGVYAPAGRAAAERARGPAGEHALRIAASLAQAGPGPVASHHSAALLHGLDVLGSVRPRAAEVTRPPGTGSRSGRPGIRVHAAALPPGHLTTHGAIPVTSVARTVVDLARTSSFRAAVVTADSALHSKQTTRAGLESVITDCARWPGIKEARRVVAFGDGRAESALESLSRAVFHEHGLPPPELQAWVGNEEEVIGRADFLWSACRTVGEADGALKYADPSRALRQLRRDARLRAAGFEVVHFTWDEITRTPARVVAAIEAAFQRGAVLAAAG